MQTGQKFEGVFKVQLNKKDFSEIGEKVAVQRFRIDTDRHVLLQTRALLLKELAAAKTTLRVWYRGHERVIHQKFKQHWMARC